jgi:hypothetical protein
MQVAGGSIVAIGIYQIYLAAKLSNPHRRWATAIVGFGVTGGMLLATSEPVAELWQASETKARITTGIQETRIAGKSSPNVYLNYLPPIALAVIVVCLFVKFKEARK